MKSSSEQAPAWSPLEFPEAPARHVPAGPPPAAPAAPVAAWILPDMVGAPTARSPEVDAVEEARSRAYEQGLRDGMARKSEEVRHALLAFRQSVGEMQSERAEQMRLLGHYVHALAVAVAQKIVQREIATDVGIVQDLVTRGLELMPANTPIEVRMNELDLEAIRPEMEEAARRDHAEPVQWLADPALERGSFVIESPQRVVSGDLDTALRALYERLEYE